ncbi:MAG: DNA-binding response regulator [Saprospiraceae bacterium]|nr:MAG: DNA-binding response regulator [Saprospiraceae bacterium]
MENKISALIIDDEEHARTNLRMLLANYPNIQLLGECPDGIAAIQTIKSTQPQLIFLDIQMPELDGFAVLRRIPENVQPYVIFTTAFNEYAIRAFEVNAVDYLLKPFDDQRFGQAVQRAVTRIRQADDWEMKTRLAQLQQFLEGEKTECFLQKLAFRANNKIRFISVTDIHWIEADNQYVKIHTSQHTPILRQSLTALDKQLDPAGFYRTHRSAIVNIEAIREIEPYFKGDYVITLHSGVKVKLSRSRVEGLRRLLNW